MFFSYLENIAYTSLFVLFTFICIPTDNILCNTIVQASGDTRLRLSRHLHITASASEYPRNSACGLVLYLYSILAIMSLPPTPVACDDNRHKNEQQHKSGWFQFMKVRLLFFTKNEEKTYTILRSLSLHLREISLLYQHRHFSCRRTVSASLANISMTIPRY